MPNVHEVLVESALTRVEVLDAVRADAAGVDPAALVDEAVGVGADALARSIVEAGVRASLQHMRAQVRDSVASVKAEAASVRAADPATVPAVTNQEIAARKAARLTEDATHG